MSEATQQTGKYRLAKCQDCGEDFEVHRSVAHLVKYCPKCRGLRRNHSPGDDASIKALRRAKVAARDRKMRRDAALRELDRRYAQLVVPVSRHELGRFVVETRGRACGSIGINRFWQYQNF